MISSTAKGDRLLGPPAQIPASLPAYTPRCYADQDTFLDTKLCSIRASCMHIKTTNVSVSR